MEVDSSGSVRILMLASAPGFENKFLKEWLSKNSYQVAARTTISRKKYQKEFFNVYEISLDRITNALLTNFDVLISDAAELAALSSQELAVIRSRVAEGGIGLIVKADSFPDPAAFYARSFPLVARKESVVKKMKLHWRTTREGVHAPAGSGTVHIRKMDGTQPLVMDEVSAVYVSSTLFGAGKIIVSTLANTYSWALAGKDTAFHSFWSMTIEQAAPPFSLPYRWIIEPALPVINEPVSLGLQTPDLELPNVMVDDSRVYFRQNVINSMEWRGSYWPDATGWRAIVKNNSSPSWLYVFKNSAWQSIRSFENRQATKEYVANKHPSQKSVSKTQDPGQRPFPKIYFLIIILITCTYLWWEKKYSNVY